MRKNRRGRRYVMNRGMRKRKRRSYNSKRNEMGTTCDGDDNDEKEQEEGDK